MTTLAEPEWDDATRNLVLALDQVELCVICGRPASVCQAAENQDEWMALPPVRCHATTAVMAKQKTFTEETNPHLDALAWGARLRASAERRAD